MDRNKIGPSGSQRRTTILPKDKNHTDDLLLASTAIVDGIKKTEGNKMLRDIKRLKKWNPKEHPIFANYPGCYAMDYYGFRETAQKIGITEGAVRKRVKRNQMASIVVNDRVMIPDKAILREQYLENGYVEVDGYEITCEYQKTITWYPPSIYAALNKWCMENLS